jgi:hypothetical protein
MDVHSISVVPSKQISYPKAPTFGGLSCQLRAPIAYGYLYEASIFLVAILKAH